MRVWLPVPTVGSSKLPITLVPGESIILFCDLCRHSHAHTYTQTHIDINNNEINSKSFFFLLIKVHLFLFLGCSILSTCIHHIVQCLRRPEEGIGPSARQFLVTKWVQEPRQGSARATYACLPTRPPPQPTPKIRFFKLSF